MPLTVSSNQGATDDTISVTSTALFDDIGIDSVLLINQDDLSAQYQNKTKGTVAGFGIDADGISKGGIEITGWLNSDTMSGAAVTNVPTALSVKNYVDAHGGGLGPFLPLTGGTLTGSLTGTTATFSGDITSSGNLNVNRLAGGLPYDNFKITTADIVTLLERIENTGDALNGFGRIDFKTNATINKPAGRGGFKIYRWI